MANGHEAELAARGRAAHDRLARAEAHGQRLLNELEHRVNVAESREAATATDRAQLVDKLTLAEGRARAADAALEAQTERANQALAELHAMREGGAKREQDACAEQRALEQRVAALEASLEKAHAIGGAAAKVEVAEVVAEVAAEAEVAAAAEAEAATAEAATAEAAEAATAEAATAEAATAEAATAEAATATTAELITAEMARLVRPAREVAPETLAALAEQARAEVHAEAAAQMELELQLLRSSEMPRGTAAQGVPAQGVPARAPEDSATTHDTRWGDAEERQVAEAQRRAFELTVEMRSRLRVARGALRARDRPTLQMLIAALGMQETLPPPDGNSTTREMPSATNLSTDGSPPPHGASGTRHAIVREGAASAGEAACLRSACARGMDVPAGAGGAGGGRGAAECDAAVPSGEPSYHDPAAVLESSRFAAAEPPRALTLAAPSATATAGIISSSEMVHSADPYSADSSSDESSADEHLKQRSAGLRASTVAPRGKEAPASPQRRVDEKAWAEAVSWLAAVTAAAAPCELEHEALRQWLMSGVVLCDLIDRVRPGCVAKPSASPMPFKQMENIGNYIEACRELGVPQQDLFVTVDLYEGKNLGAVVRNIHSLGRVAQALGFEGPALGARLAQRNERKFSALQLAQARAMPARWTNQGNSFAVSTPASPGGAPEAPETPEAPEAPEVYGSNAESAAEYKQSGMNMALLDEMCDAVFDT